MWAIRECGTREHCTPGINDNEPNYTNGPTVPTTSLRYGNAGALLFFSLSLYPPPFSSPRINFAFVSHVGNVSQALVSMGISGAKSVLADGLAGYETVIDTVSFPIR